MATATPTKPRTKAANRAKTQAEVAEVRAEQAVEAVTEAAKVEARSLVELVRDGAYATVGLTDTWIETVKTLPAQVRAEAPRVLSLVSPAATAERLEDLRETVARELDGYATRGRMVVTSISRSRATRRAVEQTKTARSQVKAATTSVRKAASASVDAVENAAEKIG